MNEVTFGEVLRWARVWRAKKAFNQLNDWEQKLADAIDAYDEDVLGPKCKCGKRRLEHIRIDDDYGDGNLCCGIFEEA